MRCSVRFRKLHRYRKLCKSRSGIAAGLNNLPFENVIKTVITEVSTLLTDFGKRS